MRANLLINIKNAKTFKLTLGFAIFYAKIFVQTKLCIKFALSFEILAYGVTGNTLVFGTKESRFET